MSPNISTVIDLYRSINELERKTSRGSEILKEGHSVVKHQYSGAHLWAWWSHSSLNWNRGGWVGGGGVQFIRSKVKRSHWRDSKKVNRSKGLETKMSGGEPSACEGNTERVSFSQSGHADTNSLLLECVQSNSTRQAWRMERKRTGEGERSLQYSCKANRNTIPS